MTVQESVAIVITLLTAATAGEADELVAAELVFQLSFTDLVGVLEVAIQMLGNEIELGCKDAGYDLHEFLGLYGLANARTPS